MRIKKNSLLIKIIFYNDIAIMITSVTIALFLIFISFESLEKKIVDSGRDKIILLSRGYNAAIINAKDDLFQVSRNINVLAGKNLNNTLTYNTVAKLIRNQLTKKNLKMYSESLITIVSADGTTLGESGNGKDYFRIDERSRHILERNLSRSESEMSNYYFSKVGKDIYARILLPFSSERNNNDKKKFIVMTMPINDNVLNELRNFVGLTDEDKIFLVVDNTYQLGDMDLKKGERFFKKKLNLEYDYFYGRKTINNNSYYLSMYNIHNYNKQYIGNIGIALSGESILKTKVKVSFSILLIVVGLIVTSTTICARIFYELLSPLNEIIDAAEGISKGNYDFTLKNEDVEEIRTLSKSFEQMAESIRNNEKMMKEKNIKLQENLNRIDAIEKILMGLQIEDDITLTVRSLQAAFTSEMGLGYSRAMYFRYSREIDTLVGECSHVNNVVKTNMMKTEKEESDGFEFQISTLTKLVALIKIPFKDDNLLGKALKEKRIIYHNDKGYKYNLGNDLFKSLGINNFLIFPIYSESRNYGCILVDYFGKDNIISQEEAELMTLLCINTSIRIGNKMLEEEKIDYERTATIGKLADRFFGRREDSLKKVISIVERMAECDYNNSCLRNGINSIREEVIKIKHENAILKEYSKSYENNMEVIEFEKFLYDVTEKMQPDLEANNITLSMFINYNGKIMGDKKQLEKVFHELIKNAKQAVINKNTSSKKINLIVTKDKNIDKIRINIIDNGIGMTEEQLSNVFDPFISFNENTPGLGLAIVQRIIKDHHGVIKFSSKIDEGTDVKITLNVYKEEI
ncbi:sensor histidine kinase [uncultured Fusobacterium sp.]|uniref:sensor histidine kinase n=1 Tax=uncultured Fusobacterium sp. TaxID=159267 RepID=UPI0025CDA349|nr:sensor histidine kinase [uncultured Fusobacterium sp.]